MDAELSITNYTYSLVLKNIFEIFFLPRNQNLRNFHDTFIVCSSPVCSIREKPDSNTRIAENRVGQGAVVSHFEIIGGRRVLCEFKVSAGPCTRAKVANDSLGV